MADDSLQNDFERRINWNLFGTGPEIVQAFREKKLDIGYMGLPPAIIGIDKGVTIKCVAGGHVEGTVMIAGMQYKSMSQFNNDISEVLSQFKGGRVGVPSKGSIHDVILNYYLKKNNLLDEVEVKNYRQSEFIAIDLKDGIIEGGVGTPSLAVFASTILDSHVIIEPKYLMKNNPSYGIFFHCNVIEKQPNLIIKFLDHHKRASYLLRNSPSVAAEKIAKTFGIVDRNYAEAVLKISPKYCIALSEDYVNTTMSFLRILKDLGYIERNLTRLDIFSTDFVQKVHPEADHYSA